MRKCKKKNDVKVGVGKLKTKTYFVFFSNARPILRALALQSELNKVSISNFVRFQLQHISSKIERAFEKRTQFSIKIGPKRTSIRQLKGP